MGEKYLVLVVEPEDTSGARIKQALAKDRFEVVAARTPRHAVEIIATRRPTLILISTAYGPQSSYRVCRKLAHYGFAVVLLEANATRETVTRAVRNGAVGMLVRPLKKEAISPRIERVLVRAGVSLPAAGEQPKIEFPEGLDSPRSGSST